MPRKPTTETIACPFCQQEVKPAGVAVHLKAKHPDWTAQRGSEAWRKIKRCPQTKRPCRICGEHLHSPNDWLNHHFAVNEHAAFKPSGSSLVAVSATPVHVLPDHTVNFCPCCRLNLTPVHVAVSEQRHGRIPLQLSGCPKCGLDLNPVEQALKFISEHAH